MNRTLRAVLTGTAALMVAGAGWGAPLSRIWTVNLGGDPLEVKVERSRDGSSRMETLLVAPEKVAEVLRADGEEIRIVDDRDLLVVTAPAGFDPATLHLGGDATPADLEQPAGRRPASREKARAESRLKRGEAASSTVVWTGSGPLTVRVGLHGSPALAEVRATRPDGQILGYVTLAASREIEMTVDLRAFLDKNRYWGPVVREVSSRRGEVSAALGTAAKRGAGLQKTVGIASYNRRIQYTSLSATSALYYTVDAGPASTCGELNSYRNGSWLFGPGWLCTDANGDSTKGPWYTANANQTDNPVFIRWPDNSTTNNEWHIWDNSCPTASITTRTSTTFAGGASDVQWGVCFTSGAKITTYFQDITTNLFWSSGTGSFSASWPNPTWVYGNLSGIPGCSGTWSVTPPPASAHVSGHQYQYYACASDGGCTNCVISGFTF
jgi:hypothetical protein